MHSSHGGQTKERKRFSKRASVAVLAKDQERRRLRTFTYSSFTIDRRPQPNHFLSLDQNVCVDEVGDDVDEEEVGEWLG